MRVFITGDKELDAALKNLPLIAQTKYAKQALDKGLDYVEESYRDRVPFASGTLREASERVWPKTRKKSIVRRGLTVRRARVNQLRRAAGLRPTRHDGGSFLYLISHEFGRGRTPATSPMRKALYGNEVKIWVRVMGEMRKLVQNGGR